MARAAYPQTDPQDFGQSPGEWQALRGELVALLDQVEGQVSRQPRQDTGYSGLSERMRDLRIQVEEVEPDTRHREALRSVKRAIDRLSDREEIAYQAASTFSERPAAPNPRDTLQSAIQQIRARHVDLAPQPAPVPAPPQPRFLDLPQFTEMAQAVGGISGRLERLEGELRNQARNQTGNVKDIAEQVAQLSHVVELLAGAVGETGQVKRLEGQIASLAKMIAQGPQVDLSGLNKRLDDVSMTVGKLADLQVQYADRVATTDKSAEVVDSVRSMGNGMRAIEEGVRNVYDRIDMIERQTALAPADLEPITLELTRITEAMAHPNQPQGLVELIDALNSRIADIENRAPAVSDLKLDVAELREAVIEAMEPRFAAIELQIESLADRIPSKADSHEFNIGLLESQVRQLVARMDQTSEQLTVLAKAYQQPPAVAPDFDFDALADLVASRTSDAIVRVDQSAPAMGAAAETDYEEIEKRLAKVMRAAATQQPPAEDLSSMRSGISEVNQRLARLELSLTERAEESRRIEAAPLADFTPPPPTREAPAADPIAEVIEASDVPPMAPLPPKRSDAMPANPATDAPLTAKPFPDAGPVRMALEAKNGPRKHHPGLNDGIDTTVAASAPPAYDPAVAAKPPRPASSFDGASEPFASPTPTAPVAMPAPAEMPAADVTAPSANTFIQAHRRAARQAAVPGVRPTKAEPVADAAPSSLIGRALARFQAVAAPAATTEAIEPARERKGVPSRKLAGDKQSRGEAWTPEDEAKERIQRAEIVEPPVADMATDDDAPPESFLTRYRRPILLAAVLVAVSILAANLILQRVVEQPAPESPPAETVGEVAPGLLDAQPMEQQTSSLSTASRIIDMVDSLKTGSIDPMSTRATTPRPMSFAPATATPDLSSAFGSKPETTGSVSPAVDAAADAIKAPVEGLAPLAMPEPLALRETATAPAVTSPVKVEMPPEVLGPQELRLAASNGDARAQFEVAAIYTEGRAVPEDLAQAAVWYERAAAQGFAPAQYRLGNLYENGRGVAKDLQQARLWYQRAAEAGNRMSMHNLAALYAGGELGKQEFDAASEWFEQAASRGMTDSQFNLGMLYARGLGVKQDMLTSYKWFSLAAERGDKDAAKARDDIARSLSPDDMSRLNAEIAAWTPQLVDMAANYAPIGTWSAKFDPGETITKKEVVLNVQAALSQLGYDTGSPDGVAGPKTAEAIKSFERATGMTEIGAINPRLLAVLGSQPV